MTGIFDDWAKSVKLDKEEDGFAKRVELPLGQKISYKVRVPSPTCAVKRLPWLLLLWFPSACPTLARGDSGAKSTVLHFHQALRHPTLRTTST